MADPEGARVGHDTLPLLPQMVMGLMANDYGHNTDDRNITDCSGILKATAHH